MKAPEFSALDASAPGALLHSRSTPLGASPLESNEQELMLTLAQTVEKLAETLMKTYVEIEALRTVVIGLSTVLHDTPELQAAFVDSMSGAIEGNLVHGLGSPMTEDMLKIRDQWLSKLMADPIWQKIQANKPA
ncbi:hypothetical protein D3C86_369050 [compost metagenome]|jgi:hypothetical protein|uniref:hypothetical protein n=1 Tax=Achromobacter sp. Root83 TaxID=1736602 RepID=UPI000B004F17|nr:hypothetical protein [Achromobacter sp. Root83]